MISSTLEAPVLLVGAAHVVDLNAALRKVLGDRVLDAMAVELDDERARVLLSEHPEESKGGGQGPMILKLWALLQRRLGAEMGGGFAGAEMRTAADLAKERSLPLFLIDDPIRVTLARLLGSLGVKERVSLVVGAILGLVLPARFVRGQLDAYSAEPGEYMDEVRRQYPAVARVLVDERNEHMADRLAELRSKGFGRVAAVVGDAHVPGLAEALRRRGCPVETIRFSELERATAP
ncbi:MAG: TraB/GumN family protein [Thermoplasmata archaeon]|nr:TraB/GumN family protein [Thermoplasmata archaeon]